MRLCESELAVRVPRAHLSRAVGLAMLAVGAACALPASAGAASPATFTSSSPTGTPRDNVVLSNGASGAVSAVWVESGKMARVRAADYRAKRDTWSPSVTLATAPAGQQVTDVAVAPSASRGDLVTWASYAPFQVAESLWVATRPHGATTWSAPVEVASGETVARPSVEWLPGERALVAWQGAVDGHLAIMTRIRAADGTWGAPTVVSDPGVSIEDNHLPPALGVSGDGQPIVAWEAGSQNSADDKIRVTRLSGSGTWSTPTGPMTTAERRDPVLLSRGSGQSPILTWREAGGLTRFAVADDLITARLGGLPAPESPGNDGDPIFATSDLGGSIVAAAPERGGVIGIYALRKGAEPWTRDQAPLLGGRSTRIVQVIRRGNRLFVLTIRDSGSSPAALYLQTRVANGPWSKPTLLSGPGGAVVSDPSTAPLGPNGLLVAWHAQRTNGSRDVDTIQSVAAQ